MQLCTWRISCCRPAPASWRHISTDGDAPGGASSTTPFSVSSGAGDPASAMLLMVACQRTAMDSKQSNGMDELLDK